MKRYVKWALTLWLAAGTAPSMAINPEYAMTVLGRHEDKAGPISATVTVTVQNGKQPDFEKLLPIMKARCEAEPGFKIFASAKQLDGTTKYSIYTVWETVGDLKLHLAPQTNADIKKQVGKLTNGSPLEAIDIVLFGEFK